MASQSADSAFRDNYLANWLLRRKRALSRAEIAELYSELRNFLVSQQRTTKEKSHDFKKNS